MIYVSEIFSTEPKIFTNEVQKKAYKVLKELKIDYQRVDTEEAITMEDCLAINQRLDVEVVKTLFLCNRQKTKFYLYITSGDKTFSTKEFSEKLNISRVSFAPEELLEEITGVKKGAATIFSVLLDEDQKINIVFDENVLEEEYYGCSDGTTTGYMKLKTKDILKNIIPYSKHEIIYLDK